MCSRDVSKPQVTRVSEIWNQIWWSRYGGRTRLLDHRKHLLPETFMEFPTHAQAVIIGGGVGGASIAYHLTQMGWTDIVVIERHELTSGSTFHSAGLVGQLRTSSSLTKMMRYSADLYRRLKSETGVDP